jgi:heme-degrading monooxygenase HmoA
MFIAMNNFQVNPDRAGEFEQVWKTRESHLQALPGFIQFTLLKADEPGEYISHTTWASREAFLGWTQSEAFKQAHAGRMPDGILAGHPRAKFYESVIVETPGAAVAAR